MGEANPGNSTAFLFLFKMLHEESRATPRKKEIHFFIVRR
jgi:hypothetical protein